MRNFLKHFGIVTFLVVIGFSATGCASLNQKIDGLTVTKLDKNNKSNAVLYFHDQVRIDQIDGEALKNVYGQTRPLAGSGTASKPKAVLGVPGGERRVSVSFIDGNMSSWNKPKEFTFNFVSGRYYQILVTPNFELIGSNDDVTPPSDAGGFLSALSTAISEGFDRPINVEIIDITGGKKRNSPSMMIGVK